MASAADPSPSDTREAPLLGSVHESVLRSLESLECARPNIAHVTRLGLKAERVPLGMTHLPLVLVFPDSSVEYWPITANEDGTPVAVTSLLTAEDSTRYEVAFSSEQQRALRPITRQIVRALGTPGLDPR